MKSYTDIEQSHKLAEILPLESADMHSEAIELDGDMVFVVVCGVGDMTKPNYGSTVWSLAALLNVFPEYNLQRTDWGNKTEYKIVVTIYEDNYASKNYDNPIDACVAMIEKLYELKKI